MNTILVIAEFDQTGIKKSTLSTLCAAKQLGDEIHLLMLGPRAQDFLTNATTFSGVTQIIYNLASCYAHPLAENISQFILSIANNYTHILAPATSFGKDFLPRVAAILDVMQISDIIKIINSNTFVRPIYAGSALAEVESQDSIKIISVRPSSFDPVDVEEKTATICESKEVFDNPHVRFIKEEFTISERPALENARVVISGGRALQSNEQFHALLEPLATKLNAAIGASRAAVDAGFAPNDYQVGQTGKVVAPDLYFAIGISGAVQHCAGMKDSKVIVAINKDADAPIFQIADYGLVGDLFSIVPELTSKL